MHSSYVSFPCNGVITPDHSIQPSGSTFTGKVSKIRITTMIQRDGDSEKTSEIAQIGIFVRPDPTLLSPITGNTPTEPILIEKQSTLYTKSSVEP